MGERPTPDAPHPGKRRPPWAPSCRPHSAQSQLARARAVGLVMGPHARTPPHPQQVDSGPRQPGQRAGSRGWESARPRRPHTQAGGAPPGRPRAAPTARKRVRCGVGDGSPRPHPPAPTASGQWAPAARREGGQSGMRERPTPDAPHPGRRRPPRAPSCRPHSAQSKHARARAVGSVTGSHARTPPHPLPVGSGPRQPAQRAGSRRWESARPRTPHTQARGVSSGTLMPPPQRAKPARKSARCGVGDGSPRPHPPTPTASG